MHLSSILAGAAILTIAAAPPLPAAQGASMSATAAATGLEAVPMGHEAFNGETCPDSLRLTATVASHGEDRVLVTIRGPRYRPDAQTLSFGGAPSATLEQSYDVEWRPGLHQVSGADGHRMHSRQELDFRLTVKDSKGRKLDTVRKEVLLICTD